MMSKYSRHQAFSDHLWIARTDAEALKLIAGAKVQFKCGSSTLGPFTIKHINMNDQQNILDGDARLKGTGVPLAFIQLSGSLHGKCKANKDTDMLEKGGVSSVASTPRPQAPAEGTPKAVLMMCETLFAHADRSKL